MPVTPFHGGFGLLAKGALAGHFSFLSFCAMQVALDLEPGYHLLRDEWPFHGFLHGIAGSTLLCGVVALAAGVVGRRLAPATPEATTLAGLLRADLAAAALPLPAVLTVVGALLGHLVPDAIVHSDVLPFAPFSDSNPLFGLVSLTVLHATLVASGGIGLALVLLRMKRSR
jgi:hypothetical protein